MNKVLIAFSLACCSIFFTSCLRQNKLISISENKLFSVEYGSFEEQLNLFNIINPGQIKTSLVMRDGFFYLINGEVGKILSLNSYGDLLTVYYDEDFYSYDKKALVDKSSLGVWKPISYPFELTGKIAVDSRKYMYVVGTVPRERTELDESENLLYSQVVLRFSSDGSVVDYIGQQGPSGTPFPIIKSIYATENNELVVVCTTNSGLTVFWFGVNGLLRYKIPIEIKDIPKLSMDSLDNPNAPSEVFVTIENIVPDCYAERIYIKVDYYLPHVDEESNTQSGVDYIKNVIYPLNIETGSYGESFTIPSYEDSVTVDFSKLTYHLPYDFLGVTKNNWLFFIVTTDKGFNVQMVQPGTQNVIKRNLDINFEDTLYYSISLSSEGIISALLCDKDSSKVVWWRTDALIDSVLKS